MKGKKTGFTTISVSIETRNKLAKLGKKGDTYNDIIEKLFERAFTTHR